MKVRDLIALLVECDPGSDTLIQSREGKHSEPKDVRENRNLKLVYIEWGCNRIEKGGVLEDTSPFRLTGDKPKKVVEFAQAMNENKRLREENSRLWKENRKLWDELQQYKIGDGGGS